MHRLPFASSFQSRQHSEVSSSSLASRSKPSSEAERDSVWLEKELLKIQREKQRLERERAKFRDREQR